MSEIITYDQMGNMQSLKRDDITRNYNYSGNQLVNTTGGPETASYQYDFNGNAKVDGRNGQAITYNVLNLPAAIPGLDLSYVYDATGNKLRKISGSNTTDYIGGIQYTNGSIDFIQTEVGLARRNGTSYSYEYNLADHLGNVRYSFHNSPSTGQIERLQSDDYYPFGLRKSSGNTISLNNKYLYNGKELQEELGQYDYGARFYDPVIGRWNVVDPMAEKSVFLSPYNYTDNSPINNIDPNGRESVTYYGAEAQAIFIQLRPQNSNNSGSDNTTYSGNGGKSLDEVKVVGRMNLEDMYYSRLERGLDPFSGYDRATSVKTWYDMKMSVYDDIKNNQFHRFIYGAATFYAGGEVGGAALGGAFRFGKSLFWSGEAASEAGEQLLLGAGRFPRLDFKFAKHAIEWSEWGSISKSVYYDRAVSLAENSVDERILGFTSKQGWTFRFNSTTGEFLTTHPNGYIETFFRPKAGIDYYLKQVQLYGH